MAMDGLPEGVPPSVRVPEQLLQASPIMERRWRRYRGEIGKKGFVLGVSTPRGKYRRRGAPGGPTSQLGGPLARPRVGPRHLPSWLAGGAPLPSLDFLGSFRSADFYLIFPEFLEHF